MFARVPKHVYDHEHPLRIRRKVSRQMVLKALIRVDGKEYGSGDKCARVIPGYAQVIKLELRFLHTSLGLHAIISVRGTAL